MIYAQRVVELIERSHDLFDSSEFDPAFREALVDLVVELGGRADVLRTATLTGAALYLVALVARKL